MGVVDSEAGVSVVRWAVVPAREDWGSFDGEACVITQTQSRGVRSPSYQAYDQPPTLLPALPLLQQPSGVLVQDMIDQPMVLPCAFPRDASVVGHFQRLNIWRRLRGCMHCVACATRVDGRRRGAAAALDFLLARRIGSGRCLSQLRMRSQQASA